MRPTVIASTPSATRRPIAVAPLRSRVYDGGLLRVAIAIPASAAARCAVLIWLVVSGRAVSMSQPAAIGFRLRTPDQSWETYTS
jgi:hypothetical protein